MAAEKLTRTAYTDPNSGLPRSGDTARSESVVDLEQYAQPLERLHGGGLHEWGVGSGLHVSAALGQAGLKVAPGIALDAEGRHIALASGGQAKVGHAQLVAVNGDGADLPTAGATGQRHVTVSWAETFDSKTFSESQFKVFQFDHTPWLRLQDSVGFVDDGSAVILATVTLDVAGNVVDLSAQHRRAVALPAERVRLRRAVRAATGSALSVAHELAGELRARAAGGLQLRVADPGDEVELGRDGGSFARLSIAAESLVARRDDGATTLRVDVAAGNVGVGQDVTPLTALHLPERGLQIGGSATAGDNFHMSSDVNGGARGLRLYGGNHGSGVHLLTVLHDGRVGVKETSPAYPLTVGGDIATVRGMIHTGRLDSSVAAPDEVVGAIGFLGPAVQHGQLSFRAGVGFELVDRSSDGPSLGYARDRYPYADLTVRNVDVRGNVTVPPNATISSGGRLHITGGELLYVLNKSGVMVGKEWGGTGNLHAQGDVRVNGTLATNNMEPLQTHGWGGGIHTWDVYAEGTIAVGRGWDNIACAMDRNGNVSASVKRFVIDHPLDPAARQLVHASLEGPETGVYYRGEAQLDGGAAVVTLPAYFEALARVGGRSVLVSPILDGDGEISTLAASAVRDGTFHVRAADGRNPSQRFYWEVKAVRADLARLDVEPAKPIDAGARVPLAVG